MIYYVSKVFWLIAAPTSALVLISAIAALWAVLGSSKFAARLASAAACPPDGIIVLAGAGDAGINAALALSRDYPKARLTFSGFSATALKRFVWAATRGAFTWRADHGRPPRMHCTPPRCSNQSPVKSGWWSR